MQLQQDVAYVVKQNTHSSIYRTLIPIDLATNAIANGASYAEGMHNLIVGCANQENYSSQQSQPYQITTVNNAKTLLAGTAHGLLNSVEQCFGFTATPPQDDGAPTYVEIPSELPTQRIIEPAEIATDEIACFAKIYQLCKQWSAKQKQHGLLLFKNEAQVKRFKDYVDNNTSKEAADNSWLYLTQDTDKTVAEYISEFKREQQANSQGLILATAASDRGDDIPADYLIMGYVPSSNTALWQARSRVARNGKYGTVMTVVSQAELSNANLSEANKQIHQLQQAYPQWSPEERGCEARFILAVEQAQKQQHNELDVLFKACQTNLCNWLAQALSQATVVLTKDDTDFLVNTMSKLEHND